MESSTADPSVDELRGFFRARLLQKERLPELAVLVRHAAGAFEPGKRYSEPRVNEILLRFSDDTAMLRRTLVELGFMDREGGGGAYWLREPPAP